VKAAGGTYRLAVSLAVTLGLCPTLSFAQVTAESEDQERLYGLTIDSIEIVSPNPALADDLKALSGLKIGDPLAPAEIRRAIKLLYQHGRYENVYVFGRRVGNVVELKLKMMARNFVEEVNVIGANRLSESDVLESAGLKLGDYVDLEILQEHRKRLAAHYFSLGYRSAAIGFAIQRQNALGASRLIVRLDEGPPTRVRKLSLNGDLRLPRWKLIELLDVEPGTVIQSSVLKRGIVRIREHYHQRGFLSVEIDPPNIDSSVGSTDGWADLSLTIRAGPKVNIEFYGNRSVPIHELQAATKDLTSDLTKEGALADAAESLFSLYEMRGYWKAKIRPINRKSSDGRNKTITFLISEGPKGRISDIRFPGNTALDEGLLREKIFFVVRQYLSLDATASKPDTEIIDHLMGYGSATSTRSFQRPYPADPNPKTVYIARAYRAAADSLETLFRASGYQTVEIEKPRIEESNNGTELRISFPVKQGIAWKIGALSFVGNEKFKTSQLFELAGLAPGEPLSFYRIDAASRALRSYYQEQGYFYVKVEEKLRKVLPRGYSVYSSSVQTSSVGNSNLREVCDRASKAGKPSCEIELVMRLDEGPLVKTKRIVVRGNKSTRRALIDEEITLGEGELLRADELEQTQRNLSRLGVFQRVTVQAIEEERLASQKDVLIELTERKHSSFELGAGLSTEEGVRAFLSYGHNNLLGTALRFQTNAKLNAQVFVGLFNDSVAKFIQQDPVEYQLAIGMQYPRILGLPRGIGMGLDAILLRDNDPAFRAQSRQVTFTADYKGLGRALGRTPVALQLQFAFDQSSIECNEELISLGLCGSQATEVQRRVTQDTDYVSILPRLSIDFRDNGLEPRKGVYFELLPQFLWGLNEESLNHVNLKSKLNAYVPLGSNLTFATSILFWRIFRFSDQDGDATCQRRLGEYEVQGLSNPGEVNCIPVNRRLFAGGRSTIRGFQEQTLFPADQMGRDEEVSPGGMLMVALKTEFRFKISDGFAGTAFFDVGDLFASPYSFSLDNITQHSFGVGLRYTTPIGPLLLDGAFRVEDGAAQFTPHFAAVGSF